ERASFERAARAEIDRAIAGGDLDRPCAPEVELALPFAPPPAHPPRRGASAAPRSADLQALGSNARHLGRAIVAPRHDLSERATVGPASTMILPPAVDRAHVMGADRDPHGALHRNHPGAFTFWCEGAQGTVSIVAPAANGARGLEHTHLVLDIPVGAQRT